MNVIKDMAAAAIVTAAILGVIGCVLVAGLVILDLACWLPHDGSGSAFPLIRVVVKWYARAAILAWAGAMVAGLVLELGDWRCRGRR